MPSIINTNPLSHLNVAYIVIIAIHVTDVSLARDMMLSLE